MINPKDIGKKKIKKSIFGYDIKEVNNYLEDIKESYELLNRENEDLKMRINMQYKQIEQYEKIEESLKESILVAQSTSEQVIKTANEKANTIIKNAELKGEETLNTFKKEIESEIQNYNRIVQESIIFKTRYKTFLEAQLDGIEDFFDQELKDKLKEDKPKEDKIKEDQLKKDIENKEDK